MTEEKPVTFECADQWYDASIVGLSLRLVLTIGSAMLRSDRLLQLIQCCAQQLSENVLRFLQVALLHRVGEHHVRAGDDVFARCGDEPSEDRCTWRLLHVIANVRFVNQNAESDECCIDQDRFGIHQIGGDLIDEARLADHVQEMVDQRAKCLLIGWRGEATFGEDHRREKMMHGAHHRSTPLLDGLHVLVEYGDVAWQHHLQDMFDGLLEVWT